MNSSEDSSGRDELTPKLLTSRGSPLYWKASLLRGETCHVIWSEWIPWLSVTTEIPAGGYLILTENKAAFLAYYNDLPLDPGQFRDVKTAIAAKDISGLQQKLKDLPLTDRQHAELLALPRLYGGRETLDRARQAITNPASQKALENLEKILEVLTVYGIEEHITLDLGEMRGFDYHSGLIFQGFLSGFGRAVCAGGRYDGLTGRYGFAAPATGFAFNLYNLLFALDGMLDERTEEGTDILLFSSEQDKAPAQRLAAVLREQGYSVARDIIGRVEAASLDYARRSHYRYLLVMDSTEEEMILIRTADGENTCVTHAAIESGQFRI